MPRKNKIWVYGVRNGFLAELAVIASNQSRLRKRNELYAQQLTNLVNQAFINERVFGSPCVDEDLDVIDLFLGSQAFSG